MTTSLPVKHYTATALILSTGKPIKALLMHHRKYDKWMPPGGHQEAHENPVETVIRETREETGLDISSIIDPPVVLDQHASQLTLPAYLFEEAIDARGSEPAHIHLDQIYVARIPEQVATHRHNEAHDIGWFTLEQIDQLDTFDNVRYLLRQEMTP